MAKLDTEDIELTTGEPIDNGGRYHRSPLNSNAGDVDVERMSHSPRLKKISTMAGTAAAMIHVKM